MRASATEQADSDTVAETICCCGKPTPEKRTALQAASLQGHFGVATIKGHLADSGHRVDVVDESHPNAVYGNGNHLNLELLLNVFVVGARTNS